MKRRLAIFAGAALAMSLALPNVALGDGPAGHKPATEAAPRVVATFPTGDDFVSFAESLAVAPDGSLYATVTIWEEDTSNVGKLYKITPDGRMRQIGPDLPVGILSGLAFDDRGYLYAGEIAFAPVDLPAGVLRFAPDGSMTRAVSLPDGSFPNGLAFHAGSLYISDSSNGAIWKVRPSASGSVTLTTPWLQDPSLGVVTEEGWEGVNGIAFRGNTLYAVNADAGTVVRIPLSNNGTPRALTEFVEPTAELIGADGIAFDAEGGLWVAVNHGDELAGGGLVRIDAHGRLDVVANDPGWLDYPTQPAFGTHGASHATLYVLNGSINTGNCNVIGLDVGVRGVRHP